MELSHFIHVHEAIGCQEDKMNFISIRIYTENISQWPVYDPGARGYSADICINTHKKNKNARYIRKSVWGFLGPLLTVLKALETHCVVYLK